jgi:hypothetical protein
MAGSDISQDNITLNLGLGGANVATDFVTTYGPSGGHFQYVKVDFGGDGASSRVTSTNPFPVRLKEINEGWKSIPVGGDTQGGPVPVTGTFDIGTIGVTISAVTVDIRSIGVGHGVSYGVTFGIVNAVSSGSQDAFGPAGTYIAVGGTVGVNKIALPTSMTFGTDRVDTAIVKGFSSGFSCASGIKIKNFQGQGGDAILTIGNSGDLGIGAAGQSGGFMLGVGEEIFIEIDNIDRLNFSAVGEGGRTTAVFTYQAS